MSKKKVEKHPVVHEVNPAVQPRKRENHEDKQKNQGDKVVKWIFGVLIALAVLYVIWSMYVGR